MSVSKIFKVLVTIVACVIIGALVLNVLLPNVTMALVNSTEDMIFRATGLSFDFNGDKNFGDKNGENGNTYVASVEKGGATSDVTGGVAGFKEKS